MDNEHSLAITDSELLPTLNEGVQEAKRVRRPPHSRRAVCFVGG